MSEAGPYLATAVLCEKVLQEADGVISLIRLIDRVVDAPDLDAPDSESSRSIGLVAVLSLKSGDAGGHATLKLVHQSPTGQTRLLAEIPVLFDGQGRGVSLTIELNLGLEQPGLHWFDVLLDDALLTRMPLEVVHVSTEELLATGRSLSSL